MNRRTLLGNIAAGLTIPLVPLPLAAAAARLERRLVLIELSGANDGLNTVVPIRDDRYRALRPTLALGGGGVFALEGDLALHLSLSDLGEVWDAGELAVVQGLGYPGLNRSHFESIALWETGGDGSGRGSRGWLTRDIETRMRGSHADAHGISLDGDMSIFASPSGLWLSLTSLGQAGAGPMASAGTTGTDNAALENIRAQYVSLDTAVGRISSKLSGYQPRFPAIEGAGDLGRQIDLAATLIEAGVTAPVLKLKITGFDTHDAQLAQHETLLGQLGRALAGLRRRLLQSGHWDKTLVMTYSEFGRRARENDSGGTDHGTAAPQILMGGGVRGGLWGRHPDLGALVDGDLVHTMDFRSLYDRVLMDGFGIPGNHFAEYRTAELAGMISTR